MLEGITRRQMLKLSSGFLGGVAATNILNLTTTQSLAILSSASGNNQKFIGPFPSWSNVKTHYLAVGDGFKDDTNAL